MNKKELSIELGFSVQTVDRYLSLGLPFRKIGGRYDFKLSEVENWIRNNIDSKIPELTERMTSKQASAKGFELLEKWLPYVDFGKMLKDMERK